MSCITADSHVTLHYRMALLVDGVERELVNTFAARPATLQMGAGQWAATVEQRLIGLAEGADVEFELAPEQAYGTHQGDLVRRLTQHQLDESAQPGWKAEPGAALEFRSAHGLPYRGVLVECGQGEALVDFNHPLAGLPMRVRVQVVGVL